MRRLTDEDLASLVGRTIQGYRVEAAKVKRGPFLDSDHYGIILGKNPKDQYVTWEFRVMKDESVSVYWGHYIMMKKRLYLQYDIYAKEALPHEKRTTRNLPH